MPISIERYVDITSAVIGAPQVQPRALVGLRFTRSPLMPSESYVTADSAADVAEFFGSGSEEHSFALDYFSYISKAPARRPPLLRFAPFHDVATPAQIIGESGTYAVGDFDSIANGSISIAISDSGQLDIEDIELTGAGSLSEVADIIQLAINAVPGPGDQFSNATVTYDVQNSRFLFASGETGEATIELFPSVEGTDLLPILGWSGGTLSPGSDAETPAEALAWADNFNDSFGSFSFDKQLEISEQIEVAQVNAAYNVKYMFLAWTVEEELADLAEALVAIPSAAVHVNGVSGADKHSEALPAAILAAINFGDQNSLPNFMFQQNPAWSGEQYSDVNDNLTANDYDAMRVNYYGNTASAGQNIQFYQRGYMTGGAASLQDMTVHAGEQWLKSQAKADLMNLLLAVNSIPANNDGRGMVMAVLTGGVIQQALFNGTIIVDKDLTPIQRAVITEMTGDGNAWHQVQAAGYILDARVEPFTGPSQLTEYQVNYVLIYAKRDVIRRIVGSHNLV